MSDTQVPNDNVDPGQTNFGDDPDLNPPPTPALPLMSDQLKTLETRVTKGAIATQALTHYTTRELTTIKQALDRVELQIYPLKLMVFILSGYNLLLISLIFWKLS